MALKCCLQKNNKYYISYLIEVILINYIELFAGIGGISSGLSHQRFNCLLAAEYDPFSKVQVTQDAYATLHPHTEITGDVRQISLRDVPEHDLLVFTPPWQSFSISGLRKGFDDTRGTLSFDALNIAKFKQPAFLLFENVKGLISHEKGNTLKTLLMAMNEIGYNVDFELMNPKDFGIPQNRSRIFIVGVRKDLIHCEHWKTTSSYTDNVLKIKSKILETTSIDSFNFNWPQTTHNAATISLLPFLDSNVDAQFYLSKEKHQFILNQMIHNNFRYSDRNNVICINPRTITNTQTRQQDRVYLSTHCMTTLQAQLNGRFNIIEDIDLHQLSFANRMQGFHIRRLTPRECLRLQNFPSNTYDILKEAGFKDAAIYKFAGNAVNALVIEKLGIELLKLYDSLCNSISLENLTTSINNN